MLRNKINFILFGMMAQLLFFSGIRAEELRLPRDGVVGQETVTGLEHHTMSLVSSQTWVVGGEVLCKLVAYVYDDVTTERPADYWELYDKNGDLLAVSWFDKFGIQRTAIDRGTVEPKLKGTFVVVVDGDSV